MSLFAKSLGEKMCGEEVREMTHVVQILLFVRFLKKIVAHYLQGLCFKVRSNIITVVKT